ncbi:growth factor receptor-bound protein 10-like [Sinocyclocheilus rhinocerous]|uniref:growth factor receptor-bound protein 10-like n=1 Tax=Sinocyclocheilus rhinocerous TaxID=307959 RepID=UPI0007BA0563|nr:PREDICTED: growth factor receptor-bound protein 10-like [Sinocyclocheilus rhinocerous]
MALAGCPDYFLHHPNYQDNVDCTPSHRPSNLIGSSFQQSSNRNSPNHPEDDVDLEALVNDMASLSSYESIYATCGTQHSDSAPLLHSTDGSGLHGNRVAPLPRAPSNKVAALHSPAHKLRRSQPMHIHAVRRLQEEELQVRPTSLPAIPNPFPELCSPSGSPVLSPGSLPQPSEPHVRVENRHCALRPVAIIHQTRMRCYLSDLLQTVFSYLSSFIFLSQNFFPEQMLAWCQETNGSIPQSQLLQNFLNSSSCPEIQGFLYMKETGRKSWKKLYMFLRRSGLYCSTKGMSKEPRHLQLLSDLEDSNIFTVTTGRKMHNAPTDYQFCIKPSKGRTELKELKMLCAEDEQSRTCWMTAFRLLKFGIREILHGAPDRGRLMKRSQRMNVLGSPSPLHPSPLSSVIHRTQLWFHGRIMREESHRMIMQQGQVDGLFLLRDSQSNPKAFVLTLCHHQKIKHFQILPFEEDGQVFFSLDDGSTKFTDLIHLVEFYQLNRGVLPCKLKHPCTMVAL